LGVTLTAADLVPALLREARLHCEGLPVHFVQANLEQPWEIEDGAFDAIFCMAVLQRSILNVERPSSCASILTFDRFEEAIVGLDRVLKLGGVLVLHRTNFRFGDTVAAARYAPRQGLPPGIPSTAKYDRDNHLIPDQWDEPISIFEKVG
jgi:ubiquinone/menaquinone biosynthesis C-methylase UbiE